MEVLQRANALEAAGRDIVRLEVGEPRFPTPQPVMRAAQKALAQDLTHYTPALGIPSLRQKIAEWYQHQYGVDLSPNRVIITPGTSGAFIIAFGLLLNPQDRFAFADPGYPCYPNMIRFLGGEPVAVAVGPENHYQLDVGQLQSELQKGLRGVLITSPSNPTGTLIPDEAFSGVIEAVEAGGGRVISDEIYHGITYGKRAKSALEFSQNTIVINGFSKYFAMTGWRLGWLIVPEEAVRQVESLAQNLFISAPTLSQHAALGAFECLPMLQERVAQYDTKRRYLLKALERMGFQVAVEPTGAFYIYADVTPVLAACGIPDSQALARGLLEEGGVAVTPGLDFGRHRSENHLRFSYAGELERIREGMERIGGYLEKMKKQGGEI
ncbi:MAG: aminotransferase class I/II-fold pyridoxal phosphate-dependent enzyme [Magnetococcales bacterium]|nr:aminotransferase class I/II-fold pyridoxal phosphate-dependent enzyme [Magnetococcales bacterium]